MENNITIGVSKEVLGLLKDVGGFSVDKLQQLYPLACQRVIIEYSLWVLFWVVFLCVSFFFLRSGMKNEDGDDFVGEKIVISSFGILGGLVGVFYSVIRLMSYRITAIGFIADMVKTVSK